MHIEIDYNGSLAKCLITGYSLEGIARKYNKTPFMQCDRMTQIMTFGAFDTIKQYWKREQKKGGEK